MPTARRVAAIEAMNPLFARLFAPRCFPARARGSDAWLDGVCFMWWDLLPIHGLANEDPIREACLDVLARTLALDALACQESALHGLGHWQHCAPSRVSSMIDAYLVRDPSAPSETRDYARAAREGRVP